METNRKPRPRQREAISARNEAVRRLVDAHLEEYTALVGEERLKLGLPEQPDTQHVMLVNRQLRQRIAELESQANE